MRSTCVCEKLNRRKNLTNSFSRFVRDSIFICIYVKVYLVSQDQINGNKEKLRRSRRSILAVTYRDSKSPGAIKIREAEESELWGPERRERE